MVNLAVKTKATAFLLNSTINLVFYGKGKVKFSTVTSLVLHSFTTFGIHLFHLTSWNKLFPNVRNSLLFTVIFNCNILSLINLTTPWCAVKWKIWSTSITGSQRKWIVRAKIWRKEDEHTPWCLWTSDAFIFCVQFKTVWYKPVTSNKLLKTYKNLIWFSQF